MGEYKKNESTDSFTMNGYVTDCLSNAMFRVKLENGLDAIAHVSGKMRRNNIRVMLNDEVTVQMNTYDLTRGRITYRFIRKKFQKRN